jgi:uncharacterized damage-inducible protein DinB
MEDLHYPIGRFEMPSAVSAVERARLIADLAALPRAMADAVAGLSAQQLDAPYRPEGWTLRQVVHHLPDSQMNGYVRFKLALTESQPAVKLFDEAAWAELPDTRQAPVDVSLALLDALQTRWALLMRAMQPAEWARTYLHPERGALRLDQALAMYAWHGRHHLAHIERTRQRNGW